MFSFCGAGGRWANPHDMVDVAAGAARSFRLVIPDRLNGREHFRVMGRAGPAAIIGPNATLASGKEDVLQVAGTLIRAFSSNLRIQS
jgi:hypothetical protein